MRFLRSAAVAVLFFPGCGTACASTVSWRSILTPHFEIYHESDWAPSGIAMELEKIHGEMRRDMSMFAPWMEKERVKVYVYSGQKSYVSGEFKPPSWSKGVAYFQKKLIVTFDPGKREKLDSVITHELAHLFFESFNVRTGKPPAWLNEGLAVMMEASSQGRPDSGPWNEALKRLPRERMRALEDFLGSSVRDGANDREAGDWYLQAYAVVRFLYRTNTRFQFKNLCSLLRDGEETEKALRAVYHFRSIRDLEESWLGWLRSLQNKKSAGTGFFSAPPSVHTQFSSFSVH